MVRRRTARSLGSLALALGAATLSAQAPQQRPTDQGFSFHMGVDLVNVSVTVTDEQGRFVSGLKKDDFEVDEDGQPMTVSQFDSDRVPVSLGIALDTSGSMAGAKIQSAQAALDRFLFDLLGAKDEVFLYRFSGQPDLVQGWTHDRQAVARALGAVKPYGGTALYDTLAEAVPLAQSGSQRKKALVVISDGEDTDSHTTIGEVQQLIRQSEVLVYAIGVGDGGGRAAGRSSSSSAPKAPASVPVPLPFPGSAPPPRRAPAPQPRSSSPASRPSVDSVDAAALHQITDDSGGRTELIDSHSDLDAATAGIADELSRQYFLGYISAAPKDGKWHTIEVRVRKGNYHVRARSGFIGS